ncbi:MAG: radical SAM protein [Thermovirgaceae bacterium]|nr:radical SAM protein [Thermovirgaceae bacterium]
MSNLSKNSSYRNRNDISRGETVLERIPAGSSPPWAMLFPSSYEVGMASLGFHSVIAELKKLGVGVERFFIGQFDSLSFETGRMIGNFPFISASVAYEPDLIAILSTFKRWNIPHRWHDRLESGGPVFGVGGALSYINPLIFSGIADWVVIGDAEPVLEYLVRECRNYTSHGDRRRFWEKLSENRSIYVPPIHREQILSGKNVPLKKSLLIDLDRAYGKSLWVTPGAAFGRTVLVELQRGCRRSCNYCTIPLSFGPARVRSLDRVIKDISAVSQVDDIQIGLVTPEAGDYPDLPGLLAYLEKTGQAVSFASLRVDNMTEDMVKAVVRSRRYALTVAPETGNERLRIACGKTFGNSTIIDKLMMARLNGVKQVKLYFMVGLPGEENSDIDSIPELCREIRGETGLRIRASAGVFVPKPMSRWEMTSIIGAEEAYSKMKRLKNAFSGEALKGCTISFQDPRESLIEYALSWSGAESPDIQIEASRRNILKKFGRDWPDKNMVRDQLELIGFGRASCQ